MLLEQNKLDEFIRIIRENLKQLQEQKVSVDAEVKFLYDAWSKGDDSLYSDLVVAAGLQERINNSLRDNELAKPKPNFGRIDYTDRTTGKDYRLYIGKHGINRGPTEIIIMDWRASASSIYYECQVGEGEYPVPSGEMIPICLNQKRTYDIEDGKLIGFYDSDTVANDELLVKYLARNKDVVLGEIIATIQQEQNRIIRERHNRNLIVQGVAGSGKTTVAVHRISYLLYNFSDKYAPDEFCIIGSNDMLLNYIASALPNLDVTNTRQYRMDQLLLHFLTEWEWLPENKYQPWSCSACISFKSSWQMARMIEQWTKEREQELLPIEDVTERGEIVFSAESMAEYLKLFSDQSLTVKMDSLNTRMAAKIKLIFDAEEPPVRKEILKKYRKHFSRNYKKKSLLQLYCELIQWLSDTCTSLYGLNPQELALWQANVKKYRFDVYDLAAMNLIAYYWLRTEDEKKIRQVFIDEAQDFGVLPYYVLKKKLPDAIFMIMGDVSQNIHFDSGMNDWKDLREHVFSDTQDRFYTLCKSYRNTMEISAYASRILDRSSFETYPIEPIVRHGEPVRLWNCQSEPDMQKTASDLIRQIREKGYDTIAVICQNEEEAGQVKELLGVNDTCADSAAEASFQKGVSVLPIALTKGLEFDAVLLWDPSAGRYQTNDADAKLLYVAVTRALHELHLLCRGELCELLAE